MTTAKLAMPTADTNVISIVDVLDAERCVRLERGAVAYAERLLERARADLREAEQRRDGLRRGAGVC